MNHRQLIDAAERQMSLCPGYSTATPPWQAFAGGGKWMQHQMNLLKPSDSVEIKPKVFTLYGLFKYGTCLLAFAGSAFLCLKIHVLLLPLAVIFFYYAEVHFLFLFPLLIDGVKKPLLESIKFTYRTGIFRTMITTTVIASFMIAGLFNTRSPLRNWYTGCLAIIIWYNYETRNRV